MNFMNVDLELTSARELGWFIEALRASTYALHSVVADGNHRATLELRDVVGDDAESVLERFSEVIEGLDADAREKWRQIETKAFDIGIQSSARKHQLNEKITVKTLARVVALGADLHITVYEPGQDDAPGGSAKA